MIIFADVEKLLNYRNFISKLSGVFQKVFDNAPPETSEIDFGFAWYMSKKLMAVRSLGKDDMMELLRVAPMCAADFLNEWFETEELKSALMWPAVQNMFAGPWSPGTATNLLLSGVFSKNHVQGGPKALVNSLEKLCVSKGVRFQTGCLVTEIVCSDEGVQGVKTSDGETMEAQIVFASCSVKETFLNLVPSSRIDYRLEKDIQDIRGKGVMAKVDFVVSKEIKFSGTDEIPTYFRNLHLIDDIERAFDSIKYEETSKRPVFEGCVVTNFDSNSSDKHVLSLQVQFVPTRSQNPDALKSEVLKNTRTELTRLIPALEKNIQNERVILPQEIEETFNLAGGNPFHAEHTLDQFVMRPNSKCAGYETPIKGLYLSGSSSHPGGGLTGAPGYLAAQIL